MKNEEVFPIIDSYLSEWLGDESMTPVTVGLLSNRPIDADKIATMDEAVRLAETDFKQRIVSTSFDPSKKSIRHLIPTLSKPFAWATAAGLLLALGWAALSAVGNRNKDAIISEIAVDQSISDQPNSQKSEYAFKPVDSVLDTTNSRPDSVAVNSSTAEATTVEKLDVSRVPFATNTISKSGSTLNHRTRSADRMSDESIGELIDGQLANLWNRTQTIPLGTVDDTTWLNRVAYKLVNRAPNDSERSMFSSADSNEKRASVVRLMLGSDDFANHWGKQLAESAMEAIGKDNVVNDPQYGSFVGWMASRINADAPLDTIYQKVLLARGSLAEGESDFSPSTFWWKKVLERNDETAAARSIVHSWLGLSATCAQCHSENRFSDWQQDDFWGLVASTQLTEIASSQSNTNETRKVANRSSEFNFYYDKPDSTVASAVAKLPGGIQLGKLRGDANAAQEAAAENALRVANWIVNNDRFEQWQASLVWNGLFNQPLITRHPLTDIDGGPDRSDLAGLLGSQLRAHDWNLKQLVSWIVLSDAFAMESLPRSAEWYVTASQSMIQSQRRTQSLYAIFPTNVETDLRAIDKLTAWFQRSSGATGRNTVLGSLAPSTSPLDSQMSVTSGVNTAQASSTTSTSLDNPTGPTAGQIELIIRSQTMPRSIEDYIDRLLQTDMNWDAVVDHAFYLSKSSSATVQERESSKRLLEISRDKRLALRRIFASQLP